MNYRGKQTIKNLVNQNSALSNIEITDGNIKPFEKIAKKYGIDFALKKDNTQKPPKFIVFFKGRDVDVLTQAFKEFTAKTVKQKAKPSILSQLNAIKETIKNMGIVKTKHKDKGMEL